MMNINLRILQIQILALLTTVMFASAEEKIQTAVDPPPASQSVRPSVNTIGEKPLDRPVLQQRYPRYRLRYGDVVVLNFIRTPEFDQTVTIQPDGYISLRGLGDLHVEGQTTPQLTETLQEAYAKILRKPVITVELKESDKPYFIADGEVMRPGKYDLRSPLTVTQAVAVAGGFNDSAKHSQVLLFRRISDDWVEVTEVNVKKMRQEADLTEDIQLQPGDMLFVPKSTLAKIERFVPRPRVRYRY